jgi:hypothetical protein
MDTWQDARYCRQQSEEYRTKAQQAPERRLKLALEAVAREYAHRADEIEAAAAKRNDAMP